MMLRSPSVLAVIAALGLAACQTAPSPSDDTAAAPAESTSEEVTATPMNLPEGVTLDDDGETILMEEFSKLETYCSDGSGALAISYVGEAGITGQLVGCEQSYETFDAARETGFADVSIVAPVVTDNALQLQAGEYTKIECGANQSSLDPASDDPSDGHMILMCF